MDDFTVRKFGALLAEQARVFGMVAENEQRRVRGESPAYTAEAFNATAHEIDIISRWGE